MHIIAAKAAAFGEALKPEFKEYCGQLVANAARLAQQFLDRGYHLVSGGTDSHLVLINLLETDLTGKVAEEALDQAGITVNKNTVPFETRSPFVTSGIRLGTPAVTTRGMKEIEMELIGGLIADILERPDDKSLIEGVEKKVQEICAAFPLYASRLASA